jgi:hypothetical protein
MRTPFPEHTLTALAIALAATFAPAQAATTAAPAATATPPVLTAPSNLGNATDPFAPGGSFSNDNGNPELGISPGQTSPGTLSGNSGPGIGGGTETLGTNGGTVNGTATAGSNTVVPVDVMGGVAGGVYGAGGTPTAVAGGSNVTIAPAGNAGAAMPLLDQATRQEQQKEARRRAEGREPRIVGIAPRTDVDRTNEMPDDPIIRY